MSLNLWQLREYVVRPTLRGVGLGGLAAEQLVLATGAAESGYQFIDQVNRGSEAPGPAYGLWQVEKSTYQDIQRWLDARKELKSKVDCLMIPLYASIDQLHGNLYLSALVCRLHYVRFPEPLPEYGDALGMAEYWKKYYNTALGAGTIDGFLYKTQAVFAMKD